MATFLKIRLENDREGNSLLGLIIKVLWAHHCAICEGKLVRRALACFHSLHNVIKFRNSE